MSLPLLGGVALGAVTVLLVTASLLDASRRSGALAVVDTRAGMLEGQDRVLLNETPEATRRAVLAPVVVVVLMPLVAGFGLGPAALPGLLIGGVISAAALGLWALGSATALEGDRKSTRLNSSHVAISYAVFCLKKKRTTRQTSCR